MVLNPSLINASGVHSLFQNRRKREENRQEWLWVLCSGFSPTPQDSWCCIRNPHGGIELLENHDSRSTSNWMHHSSMCHFALRVSIQILVPAELTAICRDDCYMNWSSTWRIHGSPPECESHGTGCRFLLPGLINILN